MANIKADKLPLIDFFNKSYFFLINYELKTPSVEMVGLFGIQRLKLNSAIFSLILTPFLLEAIDQLRPGNVTFFKKWWMKLILSKPPEATSYHKLKSLLRPQ